MTEDRCFAENRNGYCTATSAGRCPGYGQCAFFKSGWEMEKSTQHSFDRLRGLPQERQLYVADKYFKGQMPWKGSRV